MRVVTTRARVVGEATAINSGFKPGGLGEGRIARDLALSHARRTAAATSASPRRRGAASFSRTAGSATAFAISALSRSTISFGVFDGANIPIQNV